VEYRRGRGYVYRRRAPWTLPFAYLAGILACGGAVLIGLAGVSAVLPADAFGSPAKMTQAAAPASVTHAPSIVLADRLTETPGPTPTRTPQWTYTPWPTSTASPLPPTELPTEPPAEPPAQPTGYLYISANSTPMPTPALAPAAPFPTACDGPGRMNILLIGLDGRSGNYQRAARADAIAVLGVNFSEKSARLLSFPRDLWVPMPGLPENRVPEGKLNTAYVWGEADKLPGGGPVYLATVITWTFNLRIDRFAVINFSAFEQAVDAIGGIDIEVPKAIHDSRYPMGDGSTMVVDIPAGWVHLDGQSALIYARTRHQDGDFARMRRQQAVLMAVRDKVLSPETLPHLPALVQALYGTVYTNLSFDDIALLGCVAPQISRDAIQTMAIDQTMVYGWRSPKGESALQPNMELIEPVLQAWSVGQ
jgi:LCP family protein required for cell wall assembly